MKKALIVLFSAVLFLLLPFETSLAKTWNFQTTEDVYKHWKVNFSGKLDASTVSSNNVYVLDGQTKHPTTPTVTNGGSSIEVKPNSPYQMGKLYQLVISTNVKNANGITLKESVTMPFKVVDSKAIIQSVHEITSQSITVLTIATNSDVFELKIGTESLKYLGNNKFQHVLIGEKVGSKVTINAYDENNKRIDQLTYTIGQ
ncbi:Ig-like domain-containing protein [Lysinibacillus endophyticus]|uniref:Ig-like domain-containing protein n=1 Tax=Ureibacillus endophyticus TaxID=1978490 RepID=UPI00209F7AEC|nr:Ig-like domain-containing protein [Lysinibacillus endophyticus]MCP1143697.1 Ig-like domain-containing protein [Lysinibacillus endophyticus]